MGVKCLCVMTWGALTCFASEWGMPEEAANYYHAWHQRCHYQHISILMATFSFKRRCWKGFFDVLAQRIKRPLLASVEVCYCRCLLEDERLWLQSKRWNSCRHLINILCPAIFCFSHIPPSHLMGQTETFPRPDRISGTVGFWPWDPSTGEASRKPHNPAP